MKKLFVLLTLFATMNIAQAYYIYHHPPMTRVRHHKHTKSILQTCLDYKGGKGCYKRDCELYKGKKYCAYKECIKNGGGKACNDRIKSR